MLVAFLDVLYRRFYVVIYSVEDRSLLDYQYAEVFEENSQWVNWVCQLADLLAPMLLLHNLHVFLLIEYLWLIKGWFDLRWGLISVQLLHL